MRPFPRRRYRWLRDLIQDMRSLMARRDEMRTLMHGETLDPAFRERPDAGCYPSQRLSLLQLRARP